MLRHIALFQLADDATDEQVAAVVDGLRALPGQIDDIRDYEVGTDLGLAEGTYDLAVVARFDDQAGYVSYLEHPAHRRVSTELLAPIRVGRATIQFEA